jgi:hypothetical protein
MSSRPPRSRALLAWDLFMVYLAIVNVLLIAFDTTYFWVRPFYVERLPAVVGLYDPVKGVEPAADGAAPAAEPVRRRGADGEPVDRFWLVDLPFLLFFAAELFARWAAAVRRRSFARWWLYPLIHWYDVLGIVPAQQFRVFRLFRLVSIYLRLKRSDVVSVGDDVVSRGVAWLADAVSEEVTDRVTVRVLDLAQREVRAGALSQVTRQALLPRRDEVRRQIVARLAQVLSDPELHARLGSFLRLNLDGAVASSPALRRVPLPDTVLAPLVRTVGEAVYDSIVETLTASLAKEEGRQALDAVVDEVMEAFTTTLGHGEIERLIEATVLDLLAEMKAAVAVRRWAVGEADGLGGTAAVGAAPDGAVPNDAPRSASRA